MRLAGFLILYCLAMQSAFADDTNLTLTVDGITYSNVTFGTATPASVSIRHSTGIARVPLAKLSPELQKRFGYDPQTATVWQIADQKAAIERAKAEKRRALIKKFADNEFYGPLTVGMVGVFKDEIGVIKIVGKDEMLAGVRVYFKTTRSALGYNDVARTYAKYGEPEPEAWFPGSKQVLIKGISTGDWVDGQTIQLKSVFKVTGSKTPKEMKMMNLVSSETVYVLESLSP